jgi:hypothetical protein
MALVVGRYEGLFTVIFLVGFALEKYDFFG